MADEAPKRARKRRPKPDAPNWKSERELERMREKKRKLEDAEEFNDPVVRKKARAIGKKEGVRRASLSKHSEVSKKEPPRLLTIEGSSSSEFLSAVEDIFYSGEEKDAAPAPAEGKVKTKKKRKQKRKQQEYKREQERVAGVTPDETEPAPEPDAEELRLKQERKQDKKARKKRKRTERRRAGAMSEEEKGGRKGVSR